MPRAARFSTTFVRDLFHYAASQGHGIPELCAAIDLPPAALSDPDSFVDAPIAERAWRLVRERTGDADLGLHSGEHLHPSVLGVLGFAMLSCADLGAAFGRLARYWNLMSDATVVRIHREGATVRLELRLVDLPGNFLFTMRHPIESALSAALSIARGLTGRDLPLLDVTFTHPAPPRTAEHQRIFGRAPRFSAETTSLTIPTGALAWPVLQANAQLLSVIEQQIEQRLAAHPENIVDRVRQEIGRRLRGEAPALPDIARVLHTSGRALQRQLQNQGTSFRQVLDELRRDLALEHLRQPHTSIADLSFLLGFSEPSAFHRRFREWTGRTPQEFRRIPSMARRVRSAVRKAGRRTLEP